MRWDGETEQRKTVENRAVSCPVSIQANYMVMPTLQARTELTLMAQQTQQLSNVELLRRLESLEAENAAKDAKIKLLESASKMTISVESKKYGQGTISVSGFQRFPLSLHPAQWPELFTVVPTKVRDYMEKNSDHIRASAVAAETALKDLNLSTIPEKSPVRKNFKSEEEYNKALNDRHSFETKWDKVYALAMANPEMRPENKKYKPVSEILAAWK